MAQPVADRNLLFGVLALQMDFISREQLIVAMQAWVFDKQKSLGQILCDQKVLPEENRVLLDALMQKHLAKHGNDPEKSLAAVSSVTDVKRDLAQIVDADVQASLQSFGTSRPSRPVDVYATVAPSASAATTGAARFRILRPHARGGLGEVFVARDEELHREVALKEIQERQADNQESRSRFLLEAEITGGLEHPGIVPVYGLGTYGDGRPYYAMRFIRGDSLKDALERFHKSEKQMSAGERNIQLRALLGRFVDVCDAIAYAHNRGVLHRDLKPGNIMLGKYGETLVVDWGLAKPMGHPSEASQATEPGEGSLVPHSISTSSQTLAGAALGTPQYMSPEQAAGRLDRLGPASDVYSLGATLYCVLTGQPPFSDPDVGTVLQKVQRGEFVKPSAVKPSVPPALEAVCLKAMALNPGDRYVTPRALADDVEHWLADEPVSAWPEPWTVKARRWIGRHRVFVTSSAAVIIVALIGFIIAAVMLNAANERERLARQKADENFELARAAVNRYFTDVSNNELLKEPGLEPLRRKLLEAARDYNVTFLEERRGDPTLQAALAQSTFQLGVITGDLDSELHAIKLLEESANLYETLPAAKVSDETQSELAACRHHLGRLYRLTDQVKKSEESYTQALKLWNGLTTADPDNPRYRDGLARSELGLGNLQQYTRRLDAAQKSYADAIANWEKLRQADPKSPSYRRDLAVAYNNVGMIYRQQTGKKAEATQELRAAEKLQKGLVDEAPNVGQYQNDLAKTEWSLGEYQDAARLWQSFVNRHPAVTEAHVVLAEALRQLVYVYLHESLDKKAAQMAEKSVAMERKLAAGHPGVPSYEGDLARGLYMTGHVSFLTRDFVKAEAAFEEAATIQDKLVREVPEVPVYQFDLARTYHGLGRVYVQNKESKKADDAFHRAFATWKTLVKSGGEERDYKQGLFMTCFEFANYLFTGPNPKESIVWYTRALAVAPDDFKPAILKRLTLLEGR